MEDCENILYQRQVNVAKTRTKLGKPPTRLQKHAPSTLQLDHFSGGGGGNPFVVSSSGNNTSSSSSLPVIPLLSPLVVSPRPLPEAEEFKFPKCGNDEIGGSDKGGATAGGGWQHPAAAGYTDPTTFLTYFQSKCVLVNDA
ncbi:hypothetical protein ACOSP7_024934 [Xanthoceras sorbifolium]|uniref:Uncharacterized protein n=1 Tax=Xanthoceras sorbifolium TaxID=99658 RepID=A0ABQ8H7W9_9ROSI|nr:hypothetical protein JRO89_XS13G0118000 [Xanthoceras sorbifolium]